ncbi:MAG TPA: DUF4276 family protein, partial [Anaerolineales bacterium]|nr:DUF4276 family protein [Anaerolineales bacterium]
KGDKNAHITFRRGFRAFFQDLEIAPVLCGSRDEAFKRFKVATQASPDVFNVLLVDSEEPLFLQNGPRDHLSLRDKWDLPKIGDEHYHLMVRMMEAWLIADVKALHDFYGQGFNANAIPKNTNVEDVEKAKIESALKAATRQTQKGEYHKTKHAPKLLELVDVSKVRKAAHHCDRLFITLMAKLGSAK